PLGLSKKKPVRTERKGCNSGTPEHHSSNYGREVIRNPQFGSYEVTYNAIWRACINIQEYLPIKITGISSILTKLDVNDKA
ncbi:3927_t:CDS:2, partial [Ambispora leptoticha]